MRRFFIQPEQAKEQRLTLSVEESKHITRVLRLTAGSNLELIDGSDSVYQAVITATEPLVEVNITATRKLKPQQVEVRLAQGILKGQKMDLVIQKSNELGADLFIPYHSSRCQGKLDKTEKKRERWQRIALESCKQCMRPQPMQVISPVNFHDLILQSSNEPGRIKLLFWEEELEQSLQMLPDLKEFKGVDIILGPEGGLSSEEIQLARQHNWQTITLGRRILRAETAAIAALTLIQYLTGNLT